MKPKVNRKWRKKHPNQHKSFGEKRERSQKKQMNDELLSIEEDEEIIENIK